MNSKDFFTDYNNIRSKLNTGDIVLFSNRKIYMLLFQKLTNCKWTHVGMVIKSKNPDRVLLWESTTNEDLMDVEKQQIASEGTQTVFLSQRIKIYKGDIAIRQLSIERGRRNDKIVQKDLKKFKKRVKDAKFNKSVIKIFKAYANGISKTSFIKGQDDLSKFFCSELVAATYKSMGLLTGDKPANMYIPRDFSTEAKSTDLPLVNFSELGNEILVKKDDRWNFFIVKKIISKKFFSGGIVFSGDFRTGFKAFHSVYKPFQNLFRTIIRQTS